MKFKRGIGKGVLFALVSLFVITAVPATVQADATVYYFKALTGGGANAMDNKDGAALVDGDFAITVDSGVTYFHQLDDDSGAAEDSPDVISPDTNAGTKRWIEVEPTATETEGDATASQGHISGLYYEHDTDTSHDIYLYPGVARDSSDTATIELATGMTKKIDGSWSAGDDSGGMFTGSVSSDDVYSLCLIKDSDTSTVDWGYDSGADGDCSNMPAAYDYYRWVGFVVTDGSSNIERFYLVGKGKHFRFHFRTMQLLANDLDNASWTSQSCSSLLPTGTGNITEVLLGGGGDVDDSILYIARDGSTSYMQTVLSGKNPRQAYNEMYNNSNADPMWVILTGGGNFYYYKSTGSGVDVYIRSARFVR